MESISEVLPFLNISVPVLEDHGVGSQSYLCQVATTTALTALKLQIPWLMWKPDYEVKIAVCAYGRSYFHFFAPAKLSDQNMLNEGVYGDIDVTGNTVIDAVNSHVQIAE